MTKAWAKFAASLLIAINVCLISLRNVGLGSTDLGYYWATAAMLSEGNSLYVEAFDHKGPLWYLLLRFFLLFVGFDSTGVVFFYTTLALAATLATGVGVFLTSRSWTLSLLMSAAVSSLLFWEGGNGVIMLPLVALSTMAIALLSFSDSKNFLTNLLALFLAACTSLIRIDYLWLFVLMVIFVLANSRSLRDWSRNSFLVISSFGLWGAALFLSLCGTGSNLVDWFETNIGFNFQDYRLELPIIPDPKLWVIPLLASGLLAPLLSYLAQMSIEFDRKLVLSGVAILLPFTVAVVSGNITKFYNVFSIVPGLVIATALVTNHHSFHLPMKRFISALIVLPFLFVAATGTFALMLGRSWNIEERVFTTTPRLGDLRSLEASTLGRCLVATNDGWPYIISASVPELGFGIWLPLKYDVGAASEYFNSRRFWSGFNCVVIESTMGEYVETVLERLDMSGSVVDESEFYQTIAIED